MYPEMMRPLCVGDRTRKHGHGALRPAVGHRVGIGFLEVDDWGVCLLCGATLMTDEAWARLSRMIADGKYA